MKVRNTASQDTPTTDVLVVGAGIIGAACAYFIARRGLRVTLLERQGIASGASGACDGHIAVQTKAPGLHSQLADASMELYRSLPPDFHEAAEFRTCGSLLVAETPAEADALAALTAKRGETGLRVEFLTGDEARAIEPALSDRIIAATHCPSDAQADPWGITSWFADAAARAGAELARDCAVQEISPDGERIRVRTTQGARAARFVVVAAGAWTPDVLADAGRIPIRPRRGQVLVTERLPRLLNGLVLSASYLAEKFNGGAAGRATLAVEQTQLGNVLIGGTREFVGIDESVTARGARELARIAGRVFPALRSAHVIRSFAGLRPHTPDALPLIGPAPGRPRVILASGHEGDGITLAPLTGDLVARCIGDGAAPDPRIAADRFAA